MSNVLKLKPVLVAEGEKMLLCQNIVKNVRSKLKKSIEKQIFDYHEKVFIAQFCC